MGDSLILLLQLRIGDSLILYDPAMFPFVLSAGQSCSSSIPSMKSAPCGQTSGRRGPRGPRPPTPPDVLSVSGGFLYCFNRCYHPSRLVSVQTPWSLAAPRSPQFRFRLHQGRRGARSPSSIQEGRVVRPCLAVALRPSSPLDWLLAVAVVPIPSGQPQRSPRVSYASFPRSPPDLPTHMSG